MAAAGGWSAHSFVGCPPVARCGLGGGGDGQGPRDGPGRLRAIETAGPPRPQAGRSRGSAHRNHGEEVPKRGLALTPAAGHGRGTGLGGIAGSSLDAIGDAHVPGLFELVVSMTARGLGGVAARVAEFGLWGREGCKRMRRRRRRRWRAMQSEAFNFRSAISLRFARLVT